VFIADINRPPQEQLFDGATGIWSARPNGDSWSEPNRVLLAKSGEPTLDGCPTLFATALYFCSARAGIHTEIDIYLTDWQNGEALDWHNLGRQINKITKSESCMFRRMDPYLCSPRFAQAAWADMTFGSQSAKSQVGGSR
jgi:hypothetical protein